MTKINTNVGSLIAQKQLQRSNNDLSLALTRLSTGLRINTGKDDPAGLIASEGLRSDIISVERAVTNSQRANQVIATADSALGQVSNLLNDIRGLVVEAANTGALSSEQIAANQLQVDSSLEAINRIAQTTSFQGRRLLDGSLDFLTTSGTNFDKLANFEIQQANLGASGSVSVSVTVTTAATRAQVNVTNVPAATAAQNAEKSYAFTNAIAQANSGTITLTNTSETISIAAVAGEFYDGTAGNLAVSIIVDGGIGSAAEAAVAGGTLTIKVKDGTTTLADIKTAVDALNDGGGATDLVATVSNGATTFNVADSGTSGNLTGGRDAGSTTIRIVANTAGAAENSTSVSFATDGALSANTAAAAIVGGNIAVTYNGTVSYSAIATAIDGLANYTASITANAGDANFITGTDSNPGTATLAAGADSAGGITQDLTFELSGKSGVEIFTFSAGTSIATLETTIDSFSDSTGVDATINGTTLEIKSTEYGKAAFVDISIISEAVGGTFTAALGTGDRKSGLDIVATINGIQARGEGNNLSINTTTLDISTTVAAGFSGTANLTITGGGALFQLGPDVVNNQQVRLGITSLNTAKLGGVTGRLFQLASGGSAALETSPTLAAKIVEEAINSVTSLRGRLGAFQKTTLDTNIASLNDTLANLTAAQSYIRDADFAQESSRLTRAQILVQSGISVLAIANSNPQNALALLR